MKQLQDMINEMKLACKHKDKLEDTSYQAYDTTKTNLLGLLLETFSIEIQMYSMTKNKQKTRDVYKLSQKFESVMDDPRTKGILKASGGKMFMS